MWATETFFPTLKQDLAIKSHPIIAALIGGLQQVSREG